MVNAPRRLITVLLLLALSAPLFVSHVVSQSEPSGSHSGPPPGVEAIKEGLGPGDSGEAVEALQEYLKAFGHLRGRSFEHGRFDNVTEAALKSFQGAFDLSKTGIVDGPTHRLILTPRYDQIPDVAASGDPQVGDFVLFGTSWDDPNLTYAYDRFTNDITQAAQRSAMSQALAAWSSVTPLVFTEVALNQNPEIVISFESGSHGDGNPFDGPSGVLAHAYYPPSTDPPTPTLHGDAHFDDAETWTVTIPVPGGGIDLVTVAIHEFGHSLGLAHSNNPSAIMYAFYGGANRTLHSDDIAGIQALYGQAGGGGTIDAEVLSVSMNPSTVQAGGNVTGSVQVQNNGDEAAAIPVSVSGPDGFTYDTTTASVSPGNSTSFTFNWTSSVPGAFDFTATANLPGDSNSSNDSATSNTVTVTSVPETIDAEVVSASASPVSIEQDSGNVTISAQIRNNGSSTATIPVTATGPGNWSSSTSTTLASGASTTLQFNWPASVVGTHTFNVSTSLGGDQNASNNSRTTNSVNVTSPPETVDAEVVSASASPTSITQNTGNVTITAQIRNNGTSTATIPVSVTGPNSWSSSTSVNLAGGASTSVQFSWPASVVGTHTFNVSASLNGDQVPGNNSRSTNSVSVVSPPSGNALHVSNVNLIASPSGGGHALYASVTVGPNGAAASGAYLYGYFINSQNQYQFRSGTVNAAGQLSFTSSTNLTGVHQFLVVYISKPGYQYNSSLNVGNPAIVDIGGGPVPVVDASVDNVTASPSSLPLNSGNVTITATIGNNGDNTESIPVNVTGPGGYSDSQNVSVASGGQQQVTFSWPASVAGNHTFNVSTSLAGDSTPSNNSRTSPWVEVTQVTVIDAEVVTLTRSADSVEVDGPDVTFTANVRNNGTGSATFDVRLSSGSAGVNTTQQVTLGPGASQSVAFQWSPTVVGNHSFTATAELTSDSNAANDSKTSSVDVTDPPPPTGDEIYVNRIYVLDLGSSWYVYTWAATTSGQSSSGAVLTATIAAGSGQSVQRVGTIGPGGYTFMLVTPIGAGPHTFTVSGISLSGFTYNAALNVVTSATLN